MKRNIRILALILFMILIALGITTSLAWYEDHIIVNHWATRSWVGNDTTAQQMLDRLKAGNILYGISGSTRDINESILCSQRHVALYVDGVYELNVATKDWETNLRESTLTFPQDDATNGYAKAYILAAPGYVKNDSDYDTIEPTDERQYAWYFVTGQSDNGAPNDLYNIALEYQQYKKTEEKAVQVKNDRANTAISGNNTIYGPVTVSYSYKSASSGSKSDEWGGFLYAFFDQNGANITNKATLCTMSSNGTYTPIASTKITSGDNNGYYQVKSAAYNNTNLYLVTSDKTLNKVTLKIKENKVDYNATIYKLKGEYERKEAGYALCADCMNFEDALTITNDMREARDVKDSYGLPKYTLELDGKYYKYKETRNEYIYSNYMPMNVFRIGNTDYSADYSGVAEMGTYCNYCQSIHDNERHWDEWWYGFYGECEACGYFPWSMPDLMNHFEDSHMVKIYRRYAYIFEELSVGCGRDLGEKISSCGTWLPGNLYYPSQGLDIIKTAETKKSNELKLDVEIPFLTSVGVTKRWNDESNAYGTRPNSVTVNLYANGVDTGKQLTLSSSNNWYGVFAELAQKDSNNNVIDYTVIETTRTSGYTPTVEEKSTNNFTITNTLELTDVRVNKVWDDYSNRYESRPSSITVRLYSNGNKTNKTLTLNASNSWSGTFAALYKKDDNGHVIKHTVKEETALNEYSTKITENSTNNYTITNKIELIKVKVNKVWDDSSNAYGTRPSSITVVLYSNGNKTDKTLTLNSSNNWSGVFTNLPEKDSSNKIIKYTVKESTQRSGYTPIITENSANNFTITNKLELTSVKVNKVWVDFENAYNTRPNSITVKLYANGADTGKELTLNSSNNWSGTFGTLYKNDENYQKINYTIEETTKTNRYSSTITQNTSSDFEYTITNALKLTEVKINKVWDDEDNRDGIRPTSITVTLYENGTATNQKAVLNSTNNWSYTFKDLPQYKNTNDTQITYTVKESVPTEYKESTTSSGNVTNGFNFTITNQYTPKKVQVKVVKVWDDMDDIDDYRPKSLTITLYEDGVSTGKTVTLNAGNNWTATFDNLYMYKNQGKLIDYTVKEVVPDKYKETQVKTEQNGTGEITKIITYTITNKHEVHYDGYVEITGKVWLDGVGGKANDINGTHGDEDTPMKGIKVTLKDAQGKQFDATSTTYTDENGNYILKVNYDNTQNVYKLYDDAEKVKTKLNTAYVEFEYDGLKYTTVANAATGENTSKSKENETTRNSMDTKYSKITSSTKSPNEWTDKNITASTQNVISFGTYADKTTAKRDEVVKYCNGNGTYKHTNPEEAWGNIKTGTHSCANCGKTGHTLRTFAVDVQTIKNVNLGLFEREQPDVAIFSDLSKVEVTMNGQKYTYLYNVRSNANKNVGVQVKFQNKGTYTYRRPINPSDIAFIQEEANKDEMSVFVTYEVKVANLSTTLPITVHNIINSYDSRYTLHTAGWKLINATGFNQVKYDGDLNINVNPQAESSTIVLTYEVSLDAIRGLLNEEATLNNAVEIESYSTKYGAKTLYAEQRTGGREGKAYGGYDYNSHPGNAGIRINSDGRLEAAKLEDDTDIAPSFVLECKQEKPKTLSGTVFEDKDANTNDEERLGNGYYDKDTEKTLENVKVELYNIDGTLAKLYNKETKELDIDGITYTDAEGKYSLEGVVTGEYFMKFTYGNDTTKLGREATTMDGGTTKVNARNHKSTIITNTLIKNLLNKDYDTFSEEDKKWHINVEEGYSVAVDNMLDRLKLEDLQYSNFENPFSMTAYTKPFKTQVEFETIGQSQTDGEGNIDGVSNDLNKLSFGIIERPREDLFVQKTIKYLKMTLANGQVLLEGNPLTQDLNYVSPIGFRQEINSGEEARKSLEKLMRIEMDAELIQGAQLQVQYAVKVTNNNELNYDYGITTDYTDIVDGDTIGQYDKYITKSEKAKYYYYGEKTGLSEMQTTIEFVDYMSNDLVYKENPEWIIVDADELHQANNKLISDQTYNALKPNNYKVLRSSSGAQITLARKESFEQSMSASKLLSIENENVYDNNLEILKIDAKSARTIQESKDGVQVEKSYKPGNYVPGIGQGVLEQDDDRVKIIITPPTGITNYVITYIITGLVALIVIFIGISFIKKKVLAK